MLSTKGNISVKNSTARHSMNKRTHRQATWCMFIAVKNYFFFFFNIVSKFRAIFNQDIKTTTPTIPFNYKQFRGTNISTPFDMLPDPFGPHNIKPVLKILFSHDFPKVGWCNCSPGCKQPSPFLCSWLPAMCNLCASQSSDIFITPLVLPLRYPLYTLRAKELKEMMKRWINDKHEQELCIKFIFGLLRAQAAANVIN